MDLSHEASEQFVKFLYGFDLNQDHTNDREILKELVFYAGMCGLDCLQKAAASLLVKKLSKRNMPDIFEILKKNNIESEDALNFVTENFEKSELMQKNLHKKFPKLAVALLEKEAETPGLRL